MRTSQCAMVKAACFVAGIGRWVMSWRAFWKVSGDMSGYNSWDYNGMVWVK